MRRIATISLYLCFIPIVAGILVAMIGTPDGKAFGPYWPLGLLIALLGFVVPLVLTWKARKVGEPEFEADAATDFSVTGKGWYDGSGIAIDFTRKLVLLAEPGRRARVPFADLIGYSYVAQRRSGGAPINAIGTALMVASVASANSHNSKTAGFWLDTRNTGRWRLIGVPPSSGSYWIETLDMAKRGDSPKGLFGD